MFKIRKFDRYLLQETTQPFLGGIIFFISIFLMFQFLRLADFLIVQGVSITPVLKLMGALTLTFMPLGLPISFLMAVLSGFGRLSQDSELVALKASGVSLHRMSVPVWVLATVVVIFSLGLNLSWAPRAEFRVQQLLFEIGNNRLKSAIKEGTFTGFYDLLLFTDHYDPVSREMKNVFIFDERDAKTPMTVISDSGRMIPVRDQKGELAALALQLETGNIHRSEAETRTYQRIDFKDYQLYMKFDPLAAGPSQKPKALRIGELLERRAAIKDQKSGQYLELSSELWRRIATAMSCFCFVLLGIGVATVRTRGKQINPFLLSFLTVLGYWQLQVSTLYWANGGVMPAFVALQIPNILMLIFGAWFYRRACW